MLSLAVSPADRKYGAARDFSDRRDLTLSTAPVFLSPKLPSKIDLTQWCGPIKDQENEGSCTGHAYSSIREFLARKYQNLSPLLSPQFLYYEERVLEGTIGQDEGAQPRTGCIVLNKTGCCEEQFDAYKVATEFVAPSADALENAKKWTIGAYHRVNTSIEALSCLASGYPFSMAFSVYSSFEGYKIAHDGIMTVPDKKKETMLGGHEVFVVGYDLEKDMVSSKGAVLVQNSWGTDWGLDGRFWMPISLLDDASIVYDLWMCHLGHPW